MLEVLGVFAVALSVRVAYIIAFVDSGSLTLEDQMTFISAAQSILQNGLSTVTTDRVPGYPLFIATLFRLFGESNIVLLGAQAVVDSITCVLIGALTFHTLGRGFLVAGLVSAFNLNMVILSAMVLTDSFFLFFFTLFLLFLVRHAHGLALPDYTFCITFLALATVVRSASYYLVPCILLGTAVWSIYSGESTQRIGRRLLVGIAVVTILLGPQHMRNWEQYRTLDFVSQTGTTLLGWVVPAAYQYSGQGSYQDGQELARHRLEQALAVNGMKALPANPFDSSRFEGAVAKSVLIDMGWINLIKAWSIGAAINFAAPSAAFAPAVRAIEHPSFYGTPGSGVVEKLFNYISKSSGVLYHSILAIGSATSLAFFVGAVVGWWRFLRVISPEMQDRVALGVFILFSLMIGYFLLITGPIIGPKYRLPIEPIMTVFFVAALYRLFPRGRGRSSLVVQ